MIIVAVNPKATLFIVAICLLLEIFRIGLAYIMSKPSNKIQKLEEEKIATSLELATVKNVQVDFVRHSKLKRKMIKIEKEIEGLKDEIAPRLKKVKNLFRILRLCGYAVLVAYMWNTPIAVFSPKILWPFNIVTSSNTCNVPILVFIFFCAFACRHMLRSSTNILFRHIELP